MCKKITKEENGKMMYYVGKILLEFVTGLVYIEMMFTREGIRSFGEVHEEFSKVTPNEWYNYGSSYYEGAFQIPEELEILRGGWL